jgi:diaminopimelate decarboxylase
LDIVDIGGGYSMNSRTDSNNFNFIAPQIESLLKNYFPGNNKKIQIIGEPGRLIC